MLESVTAAALGKLERAVCVGHSDGSVMVLSPIGAKKEMKTWAHECPVAAISMLTEGDCARVCSVGSDGSMKVHAISGGELCLLNSGSGYTKDADTKDAYTDCVYTAKALYLGRDGELIKCKLDGEEVEQKCKLEEGAVLASCGEHVVVVHQNGKVYEYDEEFVAVEARRIEVERKVVRASVAESGSIALTYADGTVMVDGKYIGVEDAAAALFVGVTEALLVVYCDGSIARMAQLADGTWE